jgi:hypothetical protein
MGAKEGMETATANSHCTEAGVIQYEEAGAKIAQDLPITPR